MAHFAQLDENNLVTQVIVIADEHEKDGQKFINKTLGLPGKWVQTSYNNNIRKRFAAKGYTYDEVRDAFIPPKPQDESKTIIFDENDLAWVIVDEQIDG